MARTYTIVGDQTVTTPTDTALTLQSATTIRPEVYWCSFGCLSDAIDFMIRWTVQAFDTDDGTGDSTPTPTPNRNGDPASAVVTNVDHTTEPSSYLAGEILLDIPVNTRAPQQWHAHAPEDRIILPAVATEGIGFQPVHGSSTASVLVTCKYAE